ncbi:hypothetical protein ASE92_09675 [Pedobacter sp. Leaf41]|uniref:beta strand repeat-containing protein n=1 Tax=Pedobacter sp. Leaf41 TaxID=1736218 RepID=UPI00070279A2|nr:hypothetical protein [Pedobacter sp. Leaf41]KQN36371.1 hypothetical protein ASE92_09675 [Pedobacter sp. Leaf41]
MKKNLLLVLVLTLSIFSAVAQQKMKDGTVVQSNLPNKDAILELESNNKGLLFSRVMLKDSKNPAPLSAHAAGMMVYNTQKIADLVPGIYFNDGTQWILARQGQASGITYNPVTYTITYVDPATNLPVNIDLKDVIKKNETVTSLVKQEKGTYLYTSESGKTTTINVPADVINNFQSIVNDNSVRTILESIFKNNGGNVFYDGANFTYVDNNGVKQTINIAQIVKANETITTLIDNKNGTYTYTAEDGKTTLINIPANVVNNFQTIANDNTVRTIIENIVKNTGGNVFYDGANFTFIDNSGVKQTINIAQIVKANETLTVLAYDKVTNKLSYTDEKGLKADLDLNNGALAYDKATNTLNYTDGKGLVTSLPLNTTALVYDRTNNVLTYTDSKGVSITIAIKDLVAANETLTVLAYDKVTNKLSYTDEKGLKTDLDLNNGALAYDKITNTLNYTDGKGLVTSLPLNTTALVYDKTNNVLTYTDSKGNATTIAIKDLVAANETLTVLAYDKVTNKVSYTDEKGLKTDLDLNNGALAYDKATNALNYTDGKGLVTSLPLNTTALVYDKTNNVLTYTDSKGNATTISIKDLVAANETLTVLAYDKVSNKLSYTDEKGLKADLDLNNGALAYDKATNTLNYTDGKGLVTSLPLNTTALVYDKTNNVLTYTDSKGVATTIAIKDLVEANQLTASVVEGITTSVTSVASIGSPRNTEYKVEVKDAAITTAKLANNVVTTEKVVDKAVTAAKLDAGAGTVGRVGVADASGVVTYQNLTRATLTDKKDITTDGIISVNNANSLPGAVLETTELKINDNSITTKKINAPAGTSKLVLGYDGAGNVVWSTIDGIAGSTTVSNKVTGTSLITTVNGVTGDAVDLKDAIQTGQKTTVVATGTGTIVTPVTTGAVTTYTVAADLANIILAGDVIGAANATKVEKLQGTPVSATVPTASQVLTFENGAWIGKKPIVGATDVLNAGNLTSDQITFADGTGATLKNVVATVKSKSITTAMLNSDGATAGQLATADGTDGVIYKTFDATSLANKKSITGEGITVNSPAGDGTDAVLKDVKLGIADNAITAAKIATDAVETSDIKDKNVTAAKLTAGTSTIVNRIATADAAGNVTYTDLTTLVTGAETKLVNGTNTTVTGSGSVADQYKVNVATANGTTLGVVKQGNGSVVVATDGALWVDAAAITTGKALSSTDLSLSANAATSLLKDVTINIKDKAVTATKLGAATDGTDANKVATADAAGNVTYKAITDASVVSTKAITGTDINVTGGNEATLKDVSLSIKPGTAGQLLTTNAAGTATEWVNKVDATTVSNTSNLNSLTTTVNGKTGAAVNIINSNILTLDVDKKLISTVNGIATTPALDLAPAIAAAQKTSSVVNGTTTTVSSILAGNNTAYKVEVNDGAIQAGQFTTSLSNGVNTTVTSSTAGKNTNYVVNTNIASISVVGAVKPGTGLAIDATGTLTVDANTIITGKNVTIGSDKIKLGGTPAGAALKAFSIDVDETKLNLNASQIKGGTAGQVMVVGAGNVGSWVDKSILIPPTVVSNSSNLNTLTTTVNGTTGSGVTIINSNTLTLDANNKLISTVNGQATTPALDLTPAIQAAQKTTTVVAGTNVSVTPPAPNATGNAAYTVSVATANGAASGVVKQGNGSVVVATDGALSVNAAAITTGANVTAGSNRVALGGTPVGAALKAFSVDVAEANLTLANIGGKVTNNQITTGTTGQVLITKADGTTTQWVDQATLADNTTADNGLTKTANNIQLGGVLTQATIITASATNTLAVAGLQTGALKDRIMVVDPTTSIIKQVKAAMPKFFYMPSVIIPTAADQVVAEAGISGESFGVINVYARYIKQFATPLASSTGAPALPTLPSNELYYYITWYDNTVFANVKVSAEGILTYDVIKNADVTVGSFMNIVFAVK